MGGGASTKSQTTGDHTENAPAAAKGGTGLAICLEDLRSMSPADVADRVPSAFREGILETCIGGADLEDILDAAINERRRRMARSESTKAVVNLHQQAATSAEDTYKQIKASGGSGIQGMEPPRVAELMSEAIAFAMKKLSTQGKQVDEQTCTVLVAEAVEAKAKAAARRDKGYMKDQETGLCNGATAADGCTRLVLGTLNLLSDDANPWQFHPPKHELESVLSQENWDKAFGSAESAWRSVTIHQVLDLIKQAAGSDNGRLQLSQRATTFCSTLPAEQNHESASVLSLVNSGSIDLQLDNKWVAEDGRLNPIVFGLAHIEMAHEETTQMIAARQNTQDFVKNILDAYVEWECDLKQKGKPAAKGDAAKIESVTMSLLYWDVFCTIAYTSASDDFNKLALVSYLTEEEMVDGVVQPKETSEKLGALLNPVTSVATEYPHAAVVVGCQEMPATSGQLPLPPSLSLTRSHSTVSGFAALGGQPNISPTGMASTETLAEHAPPEGGDSGFLCRNLEFSDVTEQLRPTLARCMEEACGEAQVKADIKETTLRKSAVGLFTFYNTGASFAVINLHCKSFKSDTRALAAFIVKAQKAVEEEMVHRIIEQRKKREKALNLRKLKACAVEQHGIPVAILGDMNIDTKFHKKLDAAAQAKAVESAPLGKLPNGDAVDLSALTDFCDELTKANLKFEPSMEELTTIKMRTGFQGQPKKASELTVAHKDFIVLPKNDNWKLKAIKIGGHEVPPGTLGKQRRVDNMDLLQPSSVWPGDHCAVLAVLELNQMRPARASFKRK